MNPDQIYQSLKELSEKLDIPVRDQNLRKTGVHVKSGFCVVKGQNLFIMDKHLKVREKIEVLSAFLSDQSLDDIYILPVLRELLDLSAVSRDEASDDASLTASEGGDKSIPTTPEETPEKIN